MAITDSMCYGTTANGETSANWYISLRQAQDAYMNQMLSPAIASLPPAGLSRICDEDILLVANEEGY